jgi:hypothetical protein
LDRLVLRDPPGKGEMSARPGPEVTLGLLVRRDLRASLERLARRGRRATLAPKVRRAIPVQARILRAVARLDRRVPPGPRGRKVRRDLPGPPGLRVIWDRPARPGHKARSAIGVPRVRKGQAVQPGRKGHRDRKA